MCEKPDYSAQYINKALEESIEEAFNDRIKPSNKKHSKFRI